MSNAVVKVAMDRTAGPQEVSAVEAAFAEAESPPRSRHMSSTEASSFRRGWYTSRKSVGGALFTAFSAAAGVGAWKRLQRLVHKLFESRKNSRAPRGVVIFRGRLTTVLRTLCRPWSRRCPIGSRAAPEL